MAIKKCFYTRDFIGLHIFLCFLTFVPPPLPYLFSYSHVYLCGAVLPTPPTRSKPQSVLPELPSQQFTHPIRLFLVRVERENDSCKLVAFCIQSQHIGMISLKFHEHLVIIILKRDGAWLMSACIMIIH